MMFVVGTSGWYYNHWRGPFYPGALPRRAWLPYFAARLASVEINNTFYQMPQAERMANWREATPEGFLFAVKANNTITHRKKLKETHSLVLDFLAAVEHFGEKLGPILFQLPPGLAVDVERLYAFLRFLPSGYRYTFEFRNPSWFTPEVFAILAEYNAAFCVYHLNRSFSPQITTADWAYVRLHGPEGAYEGKYDADTLRRWMDVFSTWMSAGKDVYCYFDNDQAGYAVENALALQAMAKEYVGLPGLA
ncbi:MAG: DUF72 domain-containing protein [Chloroflexota bacterium]